MKKGVFWLLENDIIAFPFDSNATEGISKAGDNYNHRLLWQYVKPAKCNKPYDYYPMGRVEMSNKGKPLIYMNCNIGEEYIPEIMRRFEIMEKPIIHYDGSNHYKSHIDREDNYSKDQ